MIYAKLYIDEISMGPLSTQKDIDNYIASSLRSIHLLR